MSRVIRVTIVVGLLLALGTFAVVAGGGPDEHPLVDVAQQASQPTGCRAPSGDPSGSAPADPIGPDARVPAPRAAVPGISAGSSTEIETSGYAVGPVIETETGEAWASIRDPRSTITVGQVARVDGDRLGPIVGLVEGCAISALALGTEGAWAATCDATAPPSTAAGAELVLVTARGAGRRIAVPTPCIGSLAVEGTIAWAANLALADNPTRLWRIDLPTGAVEEPIAFGDEILRGVATTPTTVWTIRRSTVGSRLVGNDVTTGAEVASTATGPLVLLGVVEDRLWTQDESTRTLVAFDATSGEAAAPVAIPDLVGATVGPSGPWFLQASTADLTIAIGTLDDDDQIAAIMTIVGVGPDRTGLPYLPDLSVTARGVWLASQNRLFIVNG